MAVHHRTRGGTPPDPPPPPKTKVTIVGKTKLYRREHLVGPFLGHHLLGPRPPLPSPPSNTPLPAGLHNLCPKELLYKLEPPEWLFGGGMYIPSPVGPVMEANLGA